jgi:hypothetical protein
MDEAVVSLSDSLSVSLISDFDFEELTVAVSDLEKRRLQKLVEESDIELTKILFYGDSSIECVPEEKNNASVKNVLDKPVKNPFIKKAYKANKASNNAKKIVEPNGVVSVGRKKMTLARINEVFGGGSSELDPYELE